MSGVTYNRPDERLDAATGPVDLTYEAAWLVDGKPSYPVRKTGADASYDVTGTAQEVGILAVCNHLLAAGLSVVISGDVSESLTVPAYDANGIPNNAYEIITPVADVNNLTVGVTGNSGPAVIIGEFIAGKARTVPLTLARNTNWRRNTFAADRPIDRTWIPGYDKGMVADQWTGTMQVTAAMRDEVLAWEASQLSRTRPSFVVVDSPAFTTPVAMLGYIEIANQLPLGQLWKLDMRFLELPRTRW